MTVFYIYQNETNTIQNPEYLAVSSNWNINIVLLIFNTILWSPLGICRDTFGKTPIISPSEIGSPYAKPLHFLMTRHLWTGISFVYGQEWPIWPNPGFPSCLSNWVGPIVFQKIHCCRLHWTPTCSLMLSCLLHLLSHAWWYTYDELQAFLEADFEATGSG